MTKPSAVSLSLPEARAMALRAQGLWDEPAPFGAGKGAVLNAIEHLGYVQVDTISVLQRAHHHVLWTRIPDYEPAWLHELQDPDRAVFEYWNHAASYLPMRDYRYSLPLMRHHRTKLHWSRETPELVASMRRMQRMIRQKGALMLSEVESTTQVRGWYDESYGKIERRALHELFMRGVIMIRNRKGFQKIFDLPERVLPLDTDTKYPTKREAAEFHIQRGLRALGVARMAELHYLRHAEVAEPIRAAMVGLIRRGDVVEARVADFPQAPVFVRREALEALKSGWVLKERRVRFLSPFDNLTIQRKRLQWLFGFDYTVEIYVPAEKRKYGYFVLPILWGDRLVGRMDAKANRAEKRLVIHNLVFEPGFGEMEDFAPDFLNAMEEFMRFQECEEWEISRIEPIAFRRMLGSRAREGGTKTGTRKARVTPAR